MDGTHNSFLISPRQAMRFDAGLDQCWFCGLWHGGRMGAVRRFLRWKLGLKLKWYW